MGIMDIVLLISIIISLFKISVNLKGFYTDFLRHDNTVIISGLFVIFVFLSHFSSYTKADHSLIYPLFTKVLGQLIVAPFFLFSGYGIMKSIENKGDKYIMSFWKNRILKVWVHFALALLLFLMISFINHSKYGLKRIVLSFIGLSSIGNSNWYMFTLLSLYVITIISSFCFIKKKTLIPYSVAVFVIIYMYVIRMNGKAFYYYDTSFAFAFGMIFAEYENKINDYLTKNNKKYMVCFLITIILFIGASLWRSYTHLISSFIIWVSFFCLLVLMLSMKVKSNNIILRALGKYSFEIYILQRIPMNLFVKMIPNVYVYFIVCVASTGILSLIFKRMELFIDTILFGYQSSYK